MLHASALAGACAGLVSSIVTCPLDVVKTRLQAQSGRRRSARPGWTGPAAHPTGGMGGGVASQAMAQTLQRQAAAEGVNVGMVEARYEGLSGKFRALPLRERHADE